MSVTPRERLARVLDGSRSPGAFSAQLSVPARDVRLTVAGAGPISFPVKTPQAKRMIASARPARFGRGERTLMDLSVRDTWEITPDQVTLTGLDWDAILAEVRDERGLPARARLRAEPHALLVYGKGQFFLPHQDSEKDDTMIGTLVVSLPSSHTGGELVIEHNNETVAYQASADEVSVAAFYADCRHERFLPECTFRGRQNTKFQYAVLAAAALHGGTEPDLLDEVAWWQADDFWQYALFAAVAYIRAAASRAGVPGRQACQDLAQSPGHAAP